MKIKNENIEGRYGDDILSKIIEQIPIGIAAFSSDWKIDFINENFIKFGILYHFDFSSLYGINILEQELFPDINLKEELLKLKEGYSFEKEIKSIRTSDKGKISFLIKASPIFEDDKFIGGILIIEDIQLHYDESTDKNLKMQGFEKIINKSADFCFIVDTEGKIISSLGKSLKSLDVSEDILEGQNIFRIVGQQNEDFRRSLKLVKENKVSAKLIINLNLSDETAIYECKTAPLIIKEGKVDLLFVWLNEITEAIKDKRKLENELSELKFYQALTETATDSVFAVDIEGKIIFWNKAAELLFGYTRSEVYGKFFGKILSFFNHQYFEKIKQELNHLQFFKIEFPFPKGQDPLKEEKIIEAKFSLSSENKNNIVVFCNNITEKAAADRELKGSENLLNNIVSNSGEMICTISPEGEILFANNTLLNTLGYFENEILHNNLIDFIIPGEENENPLQYNFSNQQAKKSILTLISSLGKKVELETSFSPVYSENNLKYIICYFKDVTEKKIAEHNLMLFRSFFKASHDGIAVIQNRKIYLSNNSFSNIFGYRRGEELIGSSIIELVSSSDIQKVENYFLYLEEQPGTLNLFEFKGKKRDGQTFYVEISASQFEITNQFYTVIVARDVTERKRAQQALKESEEKYRNVTESIDDFLYAFEKVNTILRPVFYTSSVEKITGYSQTDLLNDSRLFLKIIYPDDINFVKRKLKNLFRSRIQSAEEFEFRIINKQGNIVWVRNKINLIRNKAGEAQKIYGLVSDISLKKTAEEELKKSTENLIKLNETKDRFISIVSHDLRTPFSSILGFTDLLLNDDDLSEEERKQYVRFIQESSHSMLKLVNSLLDWTRLQTGRINFEPEKIDINQVVEKSVNALSGASMQKKINLISLIEKDISVFADKDLLSQVFNNLISNAIKFTKEGGTISISGSPSSRMRFYEFSIIDTGIGIKPENLEMLFKIDSKYTLPGTAGEKGSGLGLNLVKEIIEKHGGTITVESEYGKGSEFKFILPIASPNILLVDDSRTDRLLYSKILKNITPDYNIETASNGLEALQMILSSPPALVITDHLMPELNGYELVQNLQKSNLKNPPPIIVLSSDIDRAAVHDYNLLQVEYVFQKPVNLTNFKQAVEKSLRKAIR